MKSIDMSEGHISKKIILFSIPILLGNLIQQIYSLSDTLVVGRFLGNEALAAVGASSALVVFINSIIIGLCMGSSVLFAELFGAKKEEELSKTISTSVIFISVLTIVLTIFLFIFIDPLLKIFSIPSEAFILSKEYLKIIFSGFIFMGLYNIGAAILRSFGNSKIALIFLIISVVINVALDFVFVIFTDLGVKGPALSTLFAQIASGIPIFIYAVKKVSFLKIKVFFDKILFKKVFKYSMMTSIQQTIMNFGILLVQGLVNSFGVIVVAAFAVSVKIDAIAYMPAQDFGNAFSIFVSQNKGKNDYDRIKKGFKSVIFISTIFCAAISILVFIYAPKLINLFSSDQNIIAIGSKYLRVEGAFYFLIGYLFIFYALFRGLGKFKTSIVLTVISLGTRVFLSYLLVYLGLGVTSIWWSIVIGWALADFAGFIIFNKLIKKMNLKTENALS